MKVILVAGARPNFMKIAPLMHEFKKQQENGEGNFSPLLVHTGQHYDISMSQIFFEELGIPRPDINLEVGSHSHAKQTAAVMERFEDVCLRERPDWVIVVGDVNSTMACTIVAAKMNIRVAHVEAGLRSFDRTMPEEINRLVTDALADLLLTPSNDADENLLREGVAPEKIKFVGNIMIDTLEANLFPAREKGTYRKYGLAPKEYVYITLHRPANVDDPVKLQAIMSILGDLSRTYPVIFPAHPRTRKKLADIDYAVEDGNGFRIIEPVGYHDSISLLEQAKFVVTDSGGLQEESSYLKVPCLTLRPNTERPVTVTQGSNRLTRIERLNEDIESVLNLSPDKLRIPELWDGNTARRIVAALQNG